MKTPFVFGRIATAENFTDRKLETAQLSTQFKSLINTIIISPRRWGKSSLVQRAADIALGEDPNLRICHIDLFNVRSEEDFYSQLALAVIKATSTKWDDALSYAREFMARLVPKISIGATPESELTIDFDWNEVRKSPDAILDLAEKIAIQKGIKIVICIDEFQNIAEFSNSEVFQKKLRTHWQRQQHVAYCLYGSKRHMMIEVFTDSSKPFYKFGNLMFLNKIPTECLVDFFKIRFEETGKQITDHAASLIAELIDCHPYYAQQLAQLSWLRTDSVCDADIVREAFSALIGQLSLLFANITESFTNQQINYLHALLAESGPITSPLTMKRYHISSATAASRSRTALIKADVLDTFGSAISFQDPVYRHWLKYDYFKL